uniref:Uncharacterized protein n=1 Tax=Glossina pallidipes TaxID=7398 RepID=A0A1B0A5C8_GLOPL
MTKILILKTIVQILDLVNERLAVNPMPHTNKNDDKRVYYCAFPRTSLSFATAHAHAHSKCFDLLRPSLNCKVEANNYYSNKTHLPIILTTRLSRRMVNHKQQRQQQQQQQQPHSFGFRIKPETSWRDTSYSMFKVISQFCLSFGAAQFRCLTFNL